MRIRSVEQADFDAWKPLWDGYNAFYGRTGRTALPLEISEATWRRFFEPQENVFAFVAERDGKLIGITHFLFHRSTTRLELVCYLQDLFTDPAERGRGVGRSLIERVYDEAKSNGIKRVYWHTQATNVAGRALYDKLAKHAGFIVYSSDI